MISINFFLNVDRNRKIYGPAKQLNAFRKLKMDDTLLAKFKYN